MKLVNPIGRNIGDALTPQACMCSSGFSSTKGWFDSCSKCGCSCSNNTTNKNNASAASSTDRKSGKFE